MQVAAGPAVTYSRCPPVALGKSQCDPCTHDVALTQVLEPVVDVPHAGAGIHRPRTAGLVIGGNAIAAPRCVVYWNCVVPFAEVQRRRIVGVPSYGYPCPGDAASEGAQKPDRS